MHPKQMGFLELLNGQVQYVVPRWQRRYRWGRAEIERLVEDLLNVTDAKEVERDHYGGTLLTFPESRTAGVVTTHRVVDGQQRLTTVSILLACIAEKLGPDGRFGDWTAQIIRDHRLTNPDVDPALRRKLRLQDGDEEEYRAILEGQPHGPGAVTQAWKTIRRLVAQNDVAKLLQGLERFRVVSIGLDSNEDPQQIFESLNATGRPLAESEKVKNWLLIGLPNKEQCDLHDTYWSKIEEVLDARDATNTEPVDIFLRDLLRWQTGELVGVDKVYEDFRRWAVREGRNDRPALLKELARLAELYGFLTGTAGKHTGKNVERRLRHLRELGIDTHRPLSLRLLSDAAAGEIAGITSEALVEVLGRIGAWSTRLWLADRPIAGINRTVTDIAHGPGPGEGEDFSSYWLERINRLRNTQSAVPSDDEVRKGIQTRKAYGGSATKTTRAILCAMMEEEHQEESPPREPLTVEHVMPRKLTEEWKRDLGEQAEDIHGRYRDLLANLVLSGDATNSKLGAKGFEHKKQVYRNSPIGMTRRIADESFWGEDALDRRAEELADEALRLWPWPETGQAIREVPSHKAKFRWRIGGGDWHAERVFAYMVLGVASALISRDPENAQRLLGTAITRDLQRAGDFPQERKGNRARLRPVPGHPDFLLYPYERDYPTTAKRCREMGERCGIEVEVELADSSLAMKFWSFLKERTGGVPGQQDEWSRRTQQTRALNTDGDHVAIELGTDLDLLSIYIVISGESRSPQERSECVGLYSRSIQQHMGEQDLSDDLEKCLEEGKETIAVQRKWDAYDEDEWPEAADWIKEQHDRLGAILNSDETTKVPEESE